MAALALGDRQPVDPTALAEQLALTVGLETAGLDYLTTDITRSPREGHGAFIEMNTHARARCADRRRVVA